jgi:hypothetical protein
VQPASCYIYLVMKRVILLLFITLLVTTTYAQNRRGGGNDSIQVRPRDIHESKGPILFREVTGIVRDSSGKPIEGATVKLKTAKDSLITNTVDKGVFIFKRVTSSSFVLTVTNIGFQPDVRKMHNDDNTRSLQLDPIILSVQSNMLGEVIVSGAPSINYKTDTVEYRAKDYKVRPNVTVDEVLKKMEGFEVGTDGTVTHQGKPLTKVRLNGKDYIGGDLAQAIRNLPADIIDKIQVVDDYGEQAKRTGIKEGDPQKVLNITTRADRSVGSMARINGGVGNNDRNKARIYLQRLSGNEVIAVLGSLDNTVNGVGGGGSSGGTTQTGGPKLNYRNDFGKKIKINASYGYNFRNVNTINESNGYRIDSLGRTDFVRSSKRLNQNKSHNFNVDLEYEIDSADYLKISPNYSYNSVSNSSTSSSFQTGLIHQDIIGGNGGSNTTPAYGASLFYQHIFRKPHRNASVWMNYSHSDNEQDNEPNNHITYYIDSLSGSANYKKDSLVHRYISRSNISKNLSVHLTYVEPFNLQSQLEFSAQVNRRSYDNQAYTSNIDPEGRNHLIDSLSNVYQYSFTETRIGINYRLNKPKYNLSMGVTAVPTVLDGAKASLGNVETHRMNFNLIPIARFEYVWSKQQRFAINYSGNPSEPRFNQIQPVRDESNPQNPVIGNPDLKPAFSHAVNTQYNNYIIDSKFNVSGNVWANFVQNQIVNNDRLIPDAYSSLKNETSFVNVGGNHSYGFNYNVSKQLDERKYNFSLNGSINYGRSVRMNRDLIYFVTNWHYNERFGPRINPNESIEINPYISFDVNKIFSTLPTSLKTDVQTTSLAIDGKFYLLENKTFTFGYDASKNFVRGLPSNITRNPLVINAYIEQDFFKKKNLAITLQIFDLLKQNSFVNQVNNGNGLTNTLTNALSRYLMFSVRWYLQKWSGAPSRNGKFLKRLGDGSFMD